MPGQYPYGAKAPIEHPTAYQFAEHPLAGLARPSRIDTFAGLNVPVRLQVRNSCVGYSLAVALEAQYLRAGIADVLLSAEMPWALARQAENDIEADTGCYPHDAYTATRNVGICAETLFSEAVPVDELPPADALADAAQRQGLSFQQCQNRDEMLTAIGNSGRPGVLCIAVHPGFEQPRPDGTIDDVTGGELLGYHAVCCYGYDDAEQRVFIRNSWGQWGAGGNCSLTYAQADDVFSEAWALQAPVTVEPAPFVADPTIAGWLSWMQSVADYLPATYAAGDVTDAGVWARTLADNAPQVAALFSGSPPSLEAPPALPQRGA